MAQRSLPEHLDPDIHVWASPEDVMSIICAPREEWLWLDTRPCWVGTTEAFILQAAKAHQDRVDRRLNR